MDVDRLRANCSRFASRHFARAGCAANGGNSVRLLFLFASAAILLLVLCCSHSKQIAIGNWTSAATNEAEIDAAMQNAATAALANRDGTIIIMDAQTGRVRAIVNPHLAYAQPL